MIPKIIHYSWISNNEKPKNIEKCMESWKEFLPDYQFINWNTDSFDFNSSIWLKEAYEAKNYAACSDYLRIYNVYHMGGIWLDTDVEVIKSFNDLLDLPYFIGLECYFPDNITENIEAATFGFEPYNNFLKLVLEWFDKRSYKEMCENGFYITLPVVMKIVAKNFFHINVIDNKDNFTIINNNWTLNIFKTEFFSPIGKNFSGKVVINNVNDNTFSIHHFAGGWFNDFIQNNGVKALWQGLS